MLRRTRHLVVGFVIAAALSAALPHARADQSVGGTEDKGGSIAGTITFEGEKKPRKVIAGIADPYCVDKNPKGILSERWIFGKDDGLANVLVQIRKGPAIDGKKFDPPKTPHIVDQVNCIYTPHVSAVVAGQKVQFRNSDATLHNVNIMAKVNTPENFGQPVKNMVSDTKLTKVEDAVPVMCNVHAWMLCYVHLLPHPYFAVTDGDGRFTINGLPDGEYELTVWHEVKAFAPKEGTKLAATIKEGKATTLNIVMTPKARD